MPAETIAQASAPSGCARRGRRPGFLERGRAFLAEYARRNADTKQLLAAIDQLQSIMVAQPIPHRTDLVKRQLRELLDEIGRAQCELDGTSPSNEDRGACRFDRSGREPDFANSVVASRCRRCAGGRDDATPIRGVRRATHHRPTHCRRSCCPKTNGLHCLREEIHAAIKRSNISTSTLPPDRIPTTILPFTSIFPASNAARPMTPPGSTTSLSSLNA
jgi:hypothetical protein